MSGERHLRVGSSHAVQAIRRRSPDRRHEPMFPPLLQEWDWSDSNICSSVGAWPRSSCSRSRGARSTRRSSAGSSASRSEAHSVINKVRGASLPFDWTINPYRGCVHACVYCFARPTHTYLDMDAGRDFETKVVVKVNAPEVLRRELAAKRWKGEHIAMGTNTDPYQRIEGPLSLDARDHRGAHRSPQSVLDPHEGHVDHARPRPATARRPSTRRCRRRSRSARSTRTSGARPSRARRARERGSRRCARWSKPASRPAC